MSDEQAQPVKGIIKALHRGTVLTKRICKTANDQPSAHMLDISESAQSLERSLARSEGTVKDAYATSVKALGNRFTEWIEHDAAITNKLQGFTISLLEQINSLDEYFDDPTAFDVGVFPYLQRQSESCCNQTLKVLGDLHLRLLKDEAAKDDRQQLSSRKRMSAGRLSFGHPSPLTESPTNSTMLQRSYIDEVHSPNVPTGTSYGSFTGETPHATQTHGLPGAWPSEQIVNSTDKGYNSSTINESHDESTWQDPFITSLTQGLKLPATDSKSKSDEPEPYLIKQEDVMHQMARNDEILAKRRRSRMMFQEELKRISTATTSSSLQPSYAASPVLTSPVTFGDSPVITSRPNSSVLMGRSQSRESQGTFSTEHGNYGSRGTVDRHDSAKHSLSGSVRSRGDSEPFMFGPPSPQQSKDDRNTSLSRNVAGFFAMSDSGLTKEVDNNKLGSPSSPRLSSPDDGSRKLSTSPPKNQSVGSGSLGDGPLSAIVGENLDVGSLARHRSLALGQSLKLPGFGDGVEAGLEPVPVISGDDPGIMLADEDNKASTPTVSILQSFDYQIKHDDSFYKLGGFCDGAKMVLRGVSGAMKQVRKPGGQYNQHVTVKCGSCDFEVGFHIYERDRTLDPKGIYAPPGIPDILFRQQILLKSHLRSKLEEPVYGCIFCVEDGHTIDPHDATVFFSSAQYFTHLQKHSRPLRNIRDLVVLYGPQPATVVDFDVIFLTTKPSKPTFSDLASKLADRPSARALVNHRKGSRGFRAGDPEGNPSLQFAVGARIVGITFPPRFKGEWCCGYHDSYKAYFPTSTVQLDPPHRGNLVMDQKSGLVATAQWDHKRDSKSGWLSFKKGDRITHISYPHPEFWCWSGMHKNAWGLFPATFVDSLIDTGTVQNSMSGPRSWARANADMAFVGVASNSLMLGLSIEEASRKQGSSSNNSPSAERNNVLSGDSGSPRPSVADVGRKGTGDGSGKKKGLFGLGLGKSADDGSGSGRLGSFSLRRHATSGSVGSMGSSETRNSSIGSGDGGGRSPF